MIKEINVKVSFTLISGRIKCPCENFLALLGKRTWA